jgi:hypothetical protein
MAESESNQAKFIRFDKVLSAKADIYKLWGISSSAKDVIKQITKTTRDIYTQIYELSINYENIMRKQL